MLAAYPADDPLHRAAGVRTGLRTRHCVRTNAAAGRCTRQGFQLPPGLACVERRQHAALEIQESGGAPELHIRALSGESLHRWPLPLRPAGGAWRWGSKALAIAYGASGEGGSAGVLLVDTSSGSCTRVALPIAADGYCLSPFLSNWSSSGLLLAQHDSADGVPWVSVLDSAGHIVAAAARPRQEQTNQAAVIEANSWAPDGQQAYMFVIDSSNFWVWRVGSVSPSLVRLPSTCFLCSVLWSFDSSRLLCFDSDQGCAYLWSDGACTESAHGSAPPAAVWGSGDRVMLMLFDNWENACPNFYRAQGTLGEAHVLSPDTCRADFTDSQSAALSPDGGLVAVPAAPLGMPQDLSCVAVMGMDGHLLQLVSVGFPADCLSWSSDSACLLVSNSDGSRLVLLDYAAD